MLRKVRKFVSMMKILFCTKWKETKTQNVNADSDSSQKVELPYFKFYYKVSASKVTDGQSKDCNQLQMRRVATGRDRQTKQTF